MNLLGAQTRGGCDTGLLATVAWENSRVYELWAQSLVFTFWFGLFGLSAVAVTLENWGLCCFGHSLKILGGGARKNVEFERSSRHLSLYGL